MKTHKGSSKRFKRVKNGFKHKQSHARHILTKKSSKRKRNLRGLKFVSSCHVKALSKMLLN